MTSKISANRVFMADGGLFRIRLAIWFLVLVTLAGAAVGARGQDLSLLSASGRAAFEAKKYEPCVQELSAIIEKGSGSDAVFATRGMCNANTSQLDAAASDAEAALKINPKNALAWLVRGYTKSRKSDFEGARADYTRSVELDPSSKMATSMLAVLENDHPSQAGVAAQNDKLAALKKAVEAGNQDFDAYERLFNQFREMNKSMEATYYFQAKAGDPKNTCAAYFYARGTEIQSLYEKAYNSFDGTNGRRCSAEAAFFLGRLNTNGNGSEKAIKWFQAALDRDPQIPAAASFLKKEKAALDSTNATYRPAGPGPGKSTTVSAASKAKVIRNAEIAERNAAIGKTLADLDVQFTALTTEYYDAKTPLARKKQLIGLMIKNCESNIAIANQALTELSDGLLDYAKNDYTTRIARARTNLSVLELDRKDLER